MLIDLINPFKKHGIDITKEKYKCYEDCNMVLSKFKLNYINGFKPAYVIYKIDVEIEYYYDIEIIALTNKINSFNLSIYEEKSDSLSYNLDDLKRLFKFTLYPKKNIYIKILNNIKNETLDLFKISVSKKKYINQLISSENID